MSCLPGYGEREQRLMRAFQHYAYRDHGFDPPGCAGCLEAAAFLTVTGYQGDVGYPTCVTIVDGDHYRDECAGLKHGRPQRRRGR